MGLKTTVGSHVFAREKAKGNAVVIQQLVDCGVIILGTVNLTAFYNPLSSCCYLLTPEKESCSHRFVS